MTYFFPAGIIFWIITLLLKNDKKEVLKQLPVEPFQGKEPEQQLFYFSNGRLLYEPHIFYYFQMLNMHQTNKITAKTIHDAADRRYSLINKIDYDENWPIATRDVNAAKGYLTDRWAYLTHLS